eukprot:Selendium_serpulae@DN2845_c0_g1_i2.p1
MEDHYGRESESRRRYQAGSPTQPLYTHQTLDALLQSTAGDGHEDIPQSNAYQTTGAHRRAKSRGGQEAGGQQPEIGSRLDERDMAAAISRRRAERGAAWEGDRYGGGADGARFWATVSGFYQPDWPDVRSFVEIHCGAFTDFEVEAQCNYRYLRFQSWEALEKCLRLDGANVPSTPFVLRVAPASSEAIYETHAPSAQTAIWQTTAFQEPTLPKTFALDNLWVAQRFDKIRSILSDAMFSYD